MVESEQNAHAALCQLQSAPCATVNTRSPFTPAWKLIKNIWVSAAFTLLSMEKVDFAVHSQTSYRRLLSEMYECLWYRNWFQLHMYGFGNVSTIYWGKINGGNWKIIFSYRINRLTRITFTTTFYTFVFFFHPDCNTILCKRGKQDLYDSRVGNDVGWLTKSNATYGHYVLRTVLSFIVCYISLCNWNIQS